MRWIKHDTSARNDIKLKLLKKRFGAEGYGVYFQLLEIIGEYIDAENLSEWGMVNKFYSAETLAEECGVAKDKLQEILTYCDEIELFSKKDNRLYCEKILSRLDDYAERIRNKKPISRNKVGTKSEQSTDNVRTKSDIDTDKDTDKDTDTDKDLNNNIAGNKKKPVSCPCLLKEKYPELSAKYPNGHNECVQYLTSVEAEKGSKFINSGKQYKALHDILKKGFSFSSMDRAIDDMKSEKFYRNAGWDFTTLANYMEKKGGIYAVKS